MSHKIQFVLWFKNDERMNWVVTRSSSSKELYQFRGWLLEQDIECLSIEAERLEMSEERS